MAKTSTGLDENTAGLLCYVLGWVSGIAFILLERENNFVKFHAVQSTIVFGAIAVAMGVFSWIPVLNIIIYVLTVLPFGEKNIVIHVHLQGQSRLGKSD